MSNIKRILLILIPTLAALFFGVCFGYEKFFDERQNGSDGIDAQRWAFIAGLFYGFIGLILGLVLDLFVWLAMTDNGNSKHLKTDD
jgi:hypothetical protein